MALPVISCNTANVPGGEEIGREGGREKGRDIEGGGGERERVCQRESINVFKSMSAIPHHIICYRPYYPSFKTFLYSYNNFTNNRESLYKTLIELCAFRLP